MIKSLLIIVYAEFMLAKSIKLLSALVEIAIFGKIVVSEPISNNFLFFTSDFSELLYILLKL